MSANAGEEQPPEGEETQPNEDAGATEEEQRHRQLAEGQTVTNPTAESLLQGAQQFVARLADGTSGVTQRSHRQIQDPIGSESSSTGEEDLITG